VLKSRKYTGGAILKGLLFFLIIAICPYSLAGTWVGSVSVTKEVPDDRSVEDMKRVCLDELKMLAASQAGSYLIETETISDSKYDQELKLVSSTFVQLENVEFNRVSEDGRLFLHSNARATVDLDEIERRVGYIRENRVLNSAVRALLAHRSEASSEAELQRLITRLARINGQEVLAATLSDVTAGGYSTARLANETLIPLLTDSSHQVLIAGYNDRGRKIVSINYYVEPPIESISSELQDLFRTASSKNNSGSEFVIRGSRYLSQEIVEDTHFDYLAEKEVVFDVLVNGKVSLTKPVLVRGNDSRFNPCEAGRSEPNSHSLCIIGYGSRSKPVRADLTVDDSEDLVISSRLRLIDRSLGF
jgi:hypothetical protein